MHLLHAVFNHLVLPPQLPGAQDANIEDVSHDVLARIIRACKTINASVDAPWSEAFRSLEASFEACLALNSGRLEKSTMLKHFSNLQPNHMLILYVVEQNAALLVRRENYDGQHRVIFEAFETSAVSEQVLAAGHALQWDFPGRSVQMSLASFADEPFQESLAAFLEQASMESLYSLQASTRKANTSVTEVRDTADPALITQMLMPLLEAIGSYFQAPILRKRGRVGYKILMCLLLAELLKESAGQLRPDLVITLRAKLCRRMAKLEMDGKEIRSTEAEAYQSLFNRIVPAITAAIEEATAQVEAAWRIFKRATTRHVPKLPLRAPDHTLQLSLLNSGGYLDGLLSSQPSRQSSFVSVDLPQPLDKSVRQIQAFTDNVFRLAAMEMRMDHDEPPNLDTSRAYEACCLQLAKQIDEVFTEVGTTYNSDPEQMSAMILTLFTLWVRLDECAVAACPLLGEYRPAFSPELLDVLQLPTMSGMCRLQNIQTYLDQRRSGCRYGTILDRVDKNCLAVRYVAQSAEMQSLGARIQTASDQARDVKEVEWERACNKYDEHTTAISDGSCCCSWRNGQRDVRGCTKCWHWRVRNRMKIQIQEAFLPKKDPARAALIFELAVPSYLSVYRDATWQILSVLAHPSRPAHSSNPEIKLKDCAPLRRYMTAKAEGISLASTIKCFVQTHYKFNAGKVPLSRVILPFAADFELYDHASGLWVKDLREPLTFQHLCGVHVPRGLQATILPARQHPPPVVDGLSSYEIQANQNECPSEMSVHEFSAYQKLLAGIVRRWPNILVEMGSSNLNFGNEDTMRVLCQLAVQAGPRLPAEVLRAAHVVFREPVFLERLIEMIEKRLHAIQTNWREHNCMELLITLSLRLFSLSSGAVRIRAETLLEAARDATLDWTTRLRKEMHAATDADAAQRIATYGFCAALLCRRTLATYVELNQVISAKDLTSWIQASVALQENLLISVDELPRKLKGMLIRDAKMAYHIQLLLRGTIISHPASVGVGIARSWSDSPNDVTTLFSPWTFLPPPHDRWIVATSSDSRQGFVFSQTVHFNVVEGHLLVDGKLRSKLPLGISNSPAVKEIFGNQHLLTYPSSLPGMTHRLVGLMCGQEVHFGMRDQQVVIRAWAKNGLLEFASRRIFAGPDNFDLPAELVDNCVHWLNLDTRCLEIRRKPMIWTKRPRDWEVDIPGRRAYRGGVNLVNPQSDVFSRVAGIFRHFEQPEKLTVYQPLAHRGRLSVELRHLELSLYVNDDGLLECRQLKAEIDPDQDAGTWYGLQSKIVLRDMITRKRSIIVPLGGIKSKRRGVHVDVRMDSAQEYGKYKIDDILGRLSCPPEPRLLYTKALCHAITSFCLPDVLTGRTGTEEAFDVLRSGAAQPWVPLGSGTHPILKTLEALSPRRGYYPTQIKRLQKVTWDEDLTVTIQHDGYESLVRDIMEKSNRLNKFASVTAKDFLIKGPTHLRRRGETHRRLYERPTLDTAGQITPDMVYVPRDRKATAKAANVYGIARLILTHCSSLYMDTTLMSMFESSHTIGGFHYKRSSPPNKEPLISQIEDPIIEQWGDLVNFCRYADNTAPLLFRLGLLAFHPRPSMDAIRLLATFASADELKSLRPPPYSSFVDFRSRGRPPIHLLQNIIVPAHLAFKPHLRRGNESRDRAGRDAQEHLDLCQEEGRKLANHILEQWPTPADGLSTENLETEVINVPLALDKIRPEWERRRENGALEGYVNQVQAVLDLRKGPRDTSALLEWKEASPAFFGKRHWQIIPSVSQDLVIKAGPCLEKPVGSILFEAKGAALRGETVSSPAKTLPSEVTELEDILNKFVSSADILRQQYGGDLLRSLEALKVTDQTDVKVPAPALGVVNSAAERAHNTAMLYLERISAALAAEDVRSMWLRLGAIWPCTSPAEVLALLRTASRHSFGTGMKKALVHYGLAVANLQHLERIHHALLRGDKRALTEELQNPGHDNWSPVQLPDWLLLEIDSDFLIRAEQVNVARAVIAPQSGRNSVLQMNMGKGKTSCIVPMVIAVLADGKSLSRLIVPKALLMQTAQMVQSRIGGLAGREVRHVPFSRKTQTTLDMLALYADLHREICGLRGLILTSHEHVLSYKLRGWQHLADNKLEVASNMIGFQHWLDDHCRDVLDECDFTLSVKTQLNYPSGAEMTVDGHPFRWQVAQELLALAAHHVAILRHKFPASIEVLERSGSFPMVHFLKSDVEDILHGHIVDDICAGRTTFLRPADTTFPNRQKHIRQVLCGQKFDGCLFMQAVNAFVNPQAASKVLLIVRGLLINRILLLCLNKRWNVQYGLHPGRHPVAVPFEAKGTPSEQSEFGHPDVAIIFTCLAFYYAGLTFKQFRQGLQRVLQSDDPAAQYEEWTSGCSDLPEALYHWNVINVDDAAQMEELWQHVRLDSVVINHYLNHFVFPAHAKQFDVKLQASAWDIPLFSQAEQHGARTTGFSGTNDNRTMLPLTIRQDDLPSLLQTSAEVLSYFLQPRNRSYKVISNAHGGRLTETGFLRQLHAANIRILIDAGAYILEMDNKTLAQAWLAVDHGAKAAVYFGNDNRAWVHYRGDAKNDVPLLATPFADNLGECVVYLDEAHTRGVDLRLPVDAHGALTLALKQTKDYTMQAAMRLRQLRTTQSVTFFAPPEVDQSIKDFCCPATDERLSSSHVVPWLLEQTCRANEDLQSLYVAQGLDFCRRTDAEWRHHNYLADPTHRTQLLDVLRQPERQTLEQLYGGASVGFSTGSQGRISALQLQVFAEQLTRCSSKRTPHHIGAFEEVEQEREAQAQVEQVRQVQKPLRYEALPFPGLHPAISCFARTGVLESTPYDQSDTSFEHAFAWVAKTSVGRHFGVRETDSKMFVSKEFGKTVKCRKDKNVADNFLRPVEWILWSPSTQTALIIIPEEAELLIPMLRLTAGESPVHLIAYAAPVTKAMLSFNRFQHYSLPPLPSEHIFPEWFRFELGVLAGRLYVDLVEWDSLACYLLRPLSAVTRRPAENDAGLGSTGRVIKFADNPAPFLLEWLALRRKTQDVLHTPMGYIF
ncbi:hypothetical protein DL767_006690 [Monosporascus sp. MG133]|nr:hypothetical protein DL767_006690 [Monosporascus sp. MG133]